MAAEANKLKYDMFDIARGCVFLSINALDFELAMG
jgi:hypothetical protein